MSSINVVSELAARDPKQIVKLTVEQYHEMIRRGIVPEGAPIELLDGIMVRKDRAKRGEDPMSVGVEHCWSVEQLREMNPELEKRGYYVQSQQPVAIPPANEPEPDAAILIGSNDDYRRRKPTAADVVCVFEVADSSLEHDRTTKLRIYAEAGIPQYVIVNLAARQIEVYTQPHGDRYEGPQIFSGDALVTIALARTETFAFTASRVLP